MERVERDRGLGEVGDNPFDEGGRCIHRGVGHGGYVAVVGLKISVLADLRACTLLPSWSSRAGDLPSD